MVNLPDRYSKIIKKLPGGGMSETLQCFDKNLERNVVVKALKNGIEKHRLMDELSALADIRSKHVVQVFDVIRNGGEIVGFVEEYIDGDELSALPNSADPDDALKTLYSVISGIADIHSHGRVHRDIKPGNMKFDAGGSLKIFDFGLAKISAEAKTAQLFFTPFFTAPEVFVPDSDGNYNFTQAVDVFAFGVTALWLLNDGDLPPSMKQIPPILPVLPFNSAAIQLSAQIVELLNRCLSANPADRPTAGEVRDTIAKYLLREKHRMLLTHSGQGYVVDASNRQVRLNSGADTVSIAYNGMEFVVTHVTGHVRHNNVAIKVGYVLEGAAVIVLGDPASRGRVSITADISHPEVMS